MPIAVNPDSGEVVYLDDQGQWSPAKRAVNPQTKEMLAFDGKQWSAIPSKGKGVMGYIGAAMKGLESGLSFGFSPQIAGGAAKAGMEEAMPYLTDEQLADVQKQGGAQGAYDSARDQEKTAQKEAGEEYPWTHAGGEVLGALAIPVGAGAHGATFAARAASTAKTGAAFGALAGAGQGDGLADRAEKALTGGIVGGVTGAVAGPAMEVARAGLSHAAAPIINAGRGIFKRDDEAARRVVSSIERDISADPNAEERLTPQEFAESRMQPGGGPAVIADIGGETTRGLARSAANTSPEGRRALNSVINKRFEDQSQRVTGWLQDNFNYPDAPALQKAIDHVQKTVNGPMYNRVYQSGDRELVSNELNQLAGTPAVSAAMRGAVERGQNRAVLDGFGAFNPAAKVTDDGRVVFNRKPNGTPSYPNIQFWDYTQRELRDAANAAQRSGRNEEAGAMFALHRRLLTELDKQVPAFKAARSTAASLFGAEDALEAGKNFVTSKMKNREAVDALAKMSPSERKLFQDGFVSHFIDTISETGDRRNVLNKIAESPAARQRLMIALGPQKASEFEAGLRVEGIMDLARGAVQGNSTTARQLQELGLAGGLDGGTLRLPRGISQMAVDALSAALRAGHGVIDRKVSQRVAEMLASNDPKVLIRGLKVVSKNSRMMDALRAADRRIAGVTGEQTSKIPALQAPAAAGANQDQGQVPGPPAQ